VKNKDWRYSNDQKFLIERVNLFLSIDKKIKKLNGKYPLLILGFIE